MKLFKSILFLCVMLSVVTNVTQAQSQQPCKLYWVNVYIHRITGNGIGYTSSVDQTIIDNLNNSFNSYGFHFQKIGSREWTGSKWVDPVTPAFAFASVGDDPAADVKANAINIYVVPKNSVFASGFVPANRKNVLIIGGTRVVNHCQGGTRSYELPETKVVAHEMGHCFGLLEAWNDTLTDTPDNVQNNECVNPTTCLFVSNCSACNVATNPTTNMNNFMSYTVPQCMTAFTSQQLNLMRYTLNTSMNTVVSKTETTPNMQLMTYDNGMPVSTVNFVSSGSHNIYTNLDPKTLSSNVSWSVSTSYISPYGTKLVNATTQVNTGQSVMVSLVATNLCGSASRNPTFVSQYGYYVYANPVVNNSLMIKFDDSEIQELLPQVISIYDEQSGELEKSVDVSKEKLNGNFSDNILTIDVAQMKRGNKVVRFFYHDLKRSAASDFITMTRVILKK